MIAGKRTGVLRLSDGRPIPAYAVCPRKHPIPAFGAACYAVQMAEEKTQLDKCIDLARDLEADEDEARWDERLKKIAKARPEAKPDEGSRQ